jgi:hypothetical protein
MVVNESDASGIYAHSVLTAGRYRFAPADALGFEYVPDSDAGASDHASSWEDSPDYVPFDELTPGVVLFFDSRLP